VLENELDQVYAALQKAERDLIEAATHGMRLLEENQKLSADAAKVETAAAERESHMRYDSTSLLLGQRVLTYCLKLQKNMSCNTAAILT
jgi:hypothetical protein